MLPPRAGELKSMLKRTIYFFIFLLYKIQVPTFMAYFNKHTYVFCADTAFSKKEGGNK